MNYAHFGGMASKNSRQDCAGKIAADFGCEQFIIFLKDAEIEVMLPAPDFPQTLPIDGSWLSFFNNTAEKGFFQGYLNVPGRGYLRATGIKAPYDAVGLFLGRHLHAESLNDFTALLPVLTSLLIHEQRIITAEAKASFAEKTAIKAEHLIKTVDGMRHMLKQALVKQEHDKKHIEELLRKKDEFMNIASHELKTPMTSLKAYMQLLIRGNGAAPPASIVNSGLKQIQRLEDLINDLLHVSKINNGKLQYNINIVDFSYILRETVTSLQVTFPRHRLEIVDNPQAFVKADVSRMEQVLINFISNAVKYSPAADRVLVRSVIKGCELIISVQDFGIGIEKKDQESIFQRFYRIDETATKYEGLGLGLYIAAEIISRHQGSFWIESEPGKGSIFYFTLPLIHNHPEQNFY